MKKYEMLILIRNDLEEEAREAELKKYSDIVAAAGGTVESYEKVGVKKLAYAIKDRTEAYCALMTFQAEAGVVKELDRVAGISSAMLRRMITKVN